MHLFLPTRIESPHSFLTYPLSFLVDDLREPPPLSVPDQVVLDAADELPHVPHHDGRVRLGALFRALDEFGHVGGEDTAGFLAQLDHALLGRFSMPS